MKKVRKFLKWLGIAIACPIALFLLVAILIYIPPVQNFIVHTVAESLSESLKMDIQIRQVRLKFPIDLAISDVTAIEKGDTLLDARGLKLDVKLLPLFEGRADIEGATLYGVKLDSKSYISDTHIVGTAGELCAEAHGVDWVNSLVKLNEIRLRDAHFDIALSDTAQKDTTTSTVDWEIRVEKALIERSQIRLSMPGDTMHIGARIEKAALADGRFDLGEGFYGFKSLEIRKSGVDYDLTNCQPTPGLDVNHLSFSDLSLLLDTLSYNGKGELRGRLRRAALTEKSGFCVNSIYGSIFMDTTRILLPELNLYTPYSRIQAKVDFDFRAMETQKGGNCNALIDAGIGTEDLRILAAGFVDSLYFEGLPQKPTTLQVDLKGNADHMVLKKLFTEIPGIATFQADGQADSLLLNQRKGNFKFDLNAIRLNALKNIIPANLRSTVHIPQGIKATGTVGFQGDLYRTHLNVRNGNGRLTAQGQINLSNEAYRLHLQSDAFPLGHFVKDLPLGPFSGTFKASGIGFDPNSARTVLMAKANVKGFHYDRYDLSGLHFDASLRRNLAKAHFGSDNPMVTADGTLKADMRGRQYKVSLNLDIPQMNMALLGVTKDTLMVGTNLELQARANRSFTDYALDGYIRHSHFSTKTISNMAKDIQFNFATNQDTTTAFMGSGDFILQLGSKGDINGLGKELTQFGAELSKQIENKVLDQEKLKSLLPVMSFYLNIGRDNFVYNLARMKGYSFKSGYVNLNTHPHIGMTGDARMSALQMGGLLLDTIDTHLMQDSTGVQMAGLVKNYKKNPYPLELNLKSNILPSGGSIEMIYFDKNRKKGLDLGLQALLTEGGLKMHLFPKNPVLAYRNFKVNKDNYIFMGKDKSISANVKLLADDGTGLHIYGEPQDSINDLTVSVNHLNLDELSSVLPYMPKIGGMLTGDIHATSNHATREFSAMADLNAEGFKYEGTPLGKVGISAIYLPKVGGEHHLSAFINSEDQEVMNFNGTYFDRDEGYIEGNAELYDFPMALLNGFLVGTDIALKGEAAGTLDVKGPVDKPVMNGQLKLNEGHIYSDVYGFDFRTDERSVDIKDSRLILQDYNLYSTGKEPLVLDGFMDMSDFSNMYMDFSMAAQNFELINTRKKAQSMVFGKVYTNYFGSLKGSFDDLSIRGKLDILDRTDMTYILKDSPLSVDNRLNDLVQFVSFEDSTANDKSKPAPEGSFDLTLGISINNAAQFHCNLSDDGQSYVNLEGGGDLTLRMTQQGEMRMTGRFTAISGEMKYALPVIPLKNFHLVSGSYVEFTGDVMNPTLNIAAKERTRSVVTENDKPRSVVFDVGVAITKPLNDMGLEFTIEAPEDLAVQNQLASMSKEQRGKAAVTMMATGMYMTDENMMSGSGFKANNALNAFLQSEIQNIAGSALKTIDINLGVESGTSETGTSTTDYSFQFAKRFWGNRISVIIGGKVSTGADAQNDAESFINNVSVEYRLDQSATRYVKVFYDRESHDPLEGQLTRTGAGLILRRKTDKLGELFIFKKKKTEKKQQHVHEL